MGRQLEAMDLWRQGLALCSRGQYKKGLVLMEKALRLDSACQEPLGSFYFHLYNDLRSGAVSSNDFSEAERRDLWRRGAELLSFNSKNGVFNNNHIANSPKVKLKGEPEYAFEKSPRGAYCGGPFEAWFRIEHDFRQYSMFAPPKMSQMEPLVTPDPEALKAPASFAKKLRAFIVPCIIIVVIQAIVYLSMLFFSYLGDYMGWH